jgi:membrane protease YdiL (CAAX protease family)
LLSRRGESILLLPSAHTIEGIRSSMNTPSQAQDTVLRHDRRFWRFVLAFYAAWVLRVVLLMPVDHSLEIGWVRQCWSQGLRLSLWVVPVVVWLNRVEGVRPAAWLRLNTFPRGRALLLGLGIMAGFLGLCAASAVIFQGGGLHRLAVMTRADWVGLVFGMSVVAFAEELLFRGFIFQRLRARQSFQRANLLTAFLFLAIHIPGWLYMQGPHWGLLPLGVSILFAGWVFGLMMEVTRSLWPPIALHLFNNVLYGVLTG